MMRGGEYPGERAWRWLRRTALRTWAAAAPRRGERELAEVSAGAPHPMTDAALEAAREARGWRWALELRQDGRYALRRMRRQPAFTLVVAATLALGIGANTAIFSLWNGLMLRPLPVRDPGGLVLLEWHARSFPDFSEFGMSGDCAASPNQGAATGCTFSLPFFNALRRSPAFGALAAYSGGRRLDVGWQGQAEVAESKFVSGGYFATLGIRPALGRFLTLDDDRPGAPLALVVSNRFWRGVLGAVGLAAGATVEVNGHPATLVGVAPASFPGLAPGEVDDAWLPLSAEARVVPGTAAVAQDPRAARWTIVGRLAPGVQPPAAAGAAGALWASQALDGPQPMLKPADAPAVTVAAAQRAFTGARSVYAQPLTVLLAAVGLILLLACVNVAGLLAARGDTRTREIAIRRAIGASRARIFRQLLTEAVALAGLGGAAGLGLAWAGAHALARMAEAGAGRPLALEAGLDHRVLWFTLGASLLTGVACGLLPARAGARLAAAKPNRRGAMMAAAQVALATVILVGAGLLVQTLRNLNAQPLGFAREHVLTFGINPGGLGYRGAERRALYRRVRDQLAALPGVEAAGAAMAPLLSLELRSGYSIAILRDAQGRELRAHELTVGEGWFRAAGIPLLEGRDFNPADLAASDAATQAAQPAILSRQLAAALFPGGAAVGRTFGATRRGSRMDPGFRVVGVVGDAKFASLRKADQPALYLPGLGSTAFFTVQTALPLAAALPAIRSAVAAVDRNLPVFAASTQAGNIAQLTFRERMLADLTAGLGGLGLLLAGLGIYGALAHEVARRRRELGIRMALGARGPRLAAAVAGRSAAIAAAGLAMGAPAAWPAARALRSLLFGVAPTSTAVWAASAALLAAAALAASIAPARRVLAADPADVLRTE